MSGYFGYVHISGFSGNPYGFDTILDFFKSMNGIIIDVRNNGGGLSEIRDNVASRFVEKKMIYRYLKWRNGPGHNDFTELEPQYIEPSSKWKFTKPVAVLTNRGCVSAGEMFVLIMKNLPNVTVIGDTTPGTVGSILTRELPNGWLYRMPASMTLTLDHEIVEGKGIAPDIYVTFSVDDAINQRDPILEKAIEVLNEKTKGND